MKRNFFKKSILLGILIPAAVFFAGCSRGGDGGSEADPFLTFESDDSFSIKTANETKNWDGTLYYSTNKETWTEWNGESISSEPANAIYLRGTGNKKITGPDGSSKKFVLSVEEGKTVSCTGNIENLLDYEKVKAGEHPEMDPYCYSGMFNNCTGLEEAPELPAETLAAYCYSGMFINCTGLKEAPELPAETLAAHCYEFMFRCCKGLTAAPELPATTLAGFCYYYMFIECKGLKEAPELPAEVLAEACYNGMFKNCTGLTAAPELTVTTLTNYCYDDMFYGCTELTTAPELPATTLKPYCYFNMFNGCSKLNYIKMMATDISATSCLTGWVSGVALTGTFVKNSVATWTVSGASGIPNGWTVETE